MSTYGFRSEMGVRKSVELCTNAVPDCLQLIMFLFELSIAIFAGHTPCLGGRIFVLVNLGQGLCRFRVFQLEKSRRQERLVVHGTPADDVVELILQYSGFDALFQAMYNLLCDHGDRFHDALEF